MVGEDSKVNLNSLPKVASIITSIVNKEIDNLCYPGCLKMDIPCTTESQQIDKDGKPIRNQKPSAELDPLLLETLKQVLEAKSS